MGEKCYSGGKADTVREQNVQGVGVEYGTFP